MISRQIICALVAASLAACSSSPSGSFAPQPSSEIARAASGARGAGTFATLYSFKGSPDGALPLAPLTYANGTFYGTTSQGGTANANGDGTVFSLTLSGGERVLYSFGGSPDGEFPQSGLTAAGSSFFGTTPNGGAATNGAVYGVDASGAEALVYSFQGGNDGALPTGALVNVGGVLYGTTSAGGGTDCNSGLGCGTVFKVDPSGAQTVIYRFQGGSDGAVPSAALVASHGALYGTTFFGGDTNCSFRGCGTIFKVTTGGKETVEYRFKGKRDGANPSAGLFALNGKFYGTTSSGGAGHGTVFEWNRMGHDRVLHRFAGRNDGKDPEAGLVSLNGTLYGTTFAGGKHGFGTIFAVLPSGGENVLHSFADKADGANPSADLIAVGDVLYGTAKTGGESGAGTVFSIAP